MDFKKKYLKYKKKYLELKKQSGSGNCGEPCYNPGDIVENTDNGKILSVVKNKYVGPNNSEEHKLANKDGNYVYLLKDLEGNCYRVKEDKLKSSNEGLASGYSVSGYVAASLASNLLGDRCIDE
jgi:hypothetical protein